MKEKLSQKGFKLNIYPEGKYYEYETHNIDIIKKLIEDLYGDEVKAILQCDENIENCKLCVVGESCLVWDLEQYEFMRKVSLI